MRGNMEESKFIFVDVDILTGEVLFVEDFEITENGEYEGVSLVTDIGTCLKIDSYHEAVSVLNDSGFYHLSIKQLN